MAAKHHHHHPRAVGKGAWESCREISLGQVLFFWRVHLWYFGVIAESARRNGATSLSVLACSRLRQSITCCCTCHGIIDDDDETRFGALFRILIKFMLNWSMPIMSPGDDGSQNAIDFVPWEINGRETLNWTDAFEWELLRFLDWFRKRFEDPDLGLGALDDETKPNGLLELLWLMGKLSSSLVLAWRKC